MRVWCDRKFAPQARSTVRAYDGSLRIDTVVAGKLRRYHHLTLWQQLTWPSLVFKNIGDAFLVLVGVVQSFFKLIAWRPDVIFTKGGYVCLPVGIAAHVLRIPLVIHDSDAHPGLTNRILSRWANAIATGAPLEHYPYNRKRSQYVGIPIDARFQPLDADAQAAAKKEWGIGAERPLLVVTGGGLGASRLNRAVLDSRQELQQHCAVILVSGAGQYDELRREVPEDTPDFQLHAYVTGMHSLLGAADVVVTRAGATTILELAALAKPTILVPNAKLTGGHQVKNAAVYAENDAVKMIDEPSMEEDARVLSRAVIEVLSAPEQAAAMATRFRAFSKPHAARDMAKIILGAVRH